MTTALLVDDTTATELVADVLHQRLGWDVTTVHTTTAVTEELVRATAPDVAIVDLSFPREPHSGLDVMVRIHRLRPDTAIAVYTDGDQTAAKLLATAWHALPIATAICKGSPLSAQVERFAELERAGAAPPDPILRPYLPESRSPWRAADAYRRLVPLAGIARMWDVLHDADRDLTYEEVAARTGLRRNSVAAYREQLKPELELHGEEHVSMPAIREFAQRCWPLLEPYVSEKLGTAPA